MSDKVTDIKIWLSQNRVCFVTNSLTLPSNLLLASLKTYIDYLPLHNYYIIPGIKNGEPFYGLQAFLEMLGYMLSNDRFDYVIYIDDDCFINDFELLVEEFKKFKVSNCCIGGPQDGGALCHRNHSKNLINTFLSFWNISMLKSKNIKLNDIISYLQKNLKDNSYKNFLIDLKTNKKSLYNFIESRSMKMLNDIKEYRNFKNKGKEPSYCEIVKNDPNNKIEPNQTPYTYDDNTATSNFEPYYLLEECLINLTNSPIYYLFATDLFDENEIERGETYDMSCLTSAIYNTSDNIKDHKLIAVHTWYSRAYTKWPTMKLQLDQTKRINTIIKKFSKL